jgi:hypothetical protein
MSRSRSKYAGVLIAGVILLMLGTAAFQVGQSPGVTGGSSGGGSGTVTNVTGTANQIAVATGTTTPVISLASPLTTPGAATITGALTNTGVHALNGTSSGSATIDPGTTATALAVSVPINGPAGSFSAPTTSYGNAARGFYGGTNAVLVTGENTVGGTVFAAARHGGGPEMNAFCLDAANFDVCDYRVAAGWKSIGTGTAATKTGVLVDGNKVFVAGDFTSAANTSLQTITGLTWSFPAVALNMSFTCDLVYSQATAAAAVAFGIQAATNAPTAINAMGQEGTSLTAFTTGTLRALATTTATNIVSATPSAAGAIGTAADMFNVHLAGTIENAANLNTVNIMISTANSADLPTVYRGSFCSIY